MKDYSKSIEHYFNWDYQESTCINIKELSKLDAIKAIEAFKYLKKTLGIGFPLNCMDSSHPLSVYFWNTAPWTRSWFTWLAACLRELQQAANFKEILDKLCSKDTSHVCEAVSILETAYRFHKVGWDVQFCDEVQNNSNKRKVPDLSITNQLTTEKIIVEVSRLGKDEEIQRYEELSFLTFQNGLNYAGRLLRKVSREHWESIVKEVRQKLQFSKEHNCFQEINHADVIDLGMDYAGSKVLAEWCQEKGISLNSFELPRFNPFERIKTKIIHKGSQMSQSNVSILVIHQENHSHLLPSLTNTVHQIEETIFKFEDLAAVVITGWEFGPSNKEIISQGLNCLVQKTERHAMSSRNIIIFNKFYKKVPITLHSLQKLMDTFC